MVECNSIDYDKELSLNNQKFRLNKISEIKDYFIAEIKEKELMSKILSKYIAFCDYFDKPLIVLSATSSSISIASFFNSYWNTCRNSKCKSQPCIFIVYWN